MSTNETQAAQFEARAKDFDEFLRKRIESLNQRLDETVFRHRDLLKTERAEVEAIHVIFKRMFAGWL